MSAEQCGECGFDSEDWSDTGTIAAIERLPSQWAAAVAGLTPGDQLRRPVHQMWSMAEYADHVREVLFGMRLLLDTAISQPGPTSESRRRNGSLLSLDRLMSERLSTASTGRPAPCAGSYTDSPLTTGP